MPRRRCPTCRSEGSYECYACDGDGAWEDRGCRVCNDEGSTDCSTCDGDGMVETVVAVADVTSLDLLNKNEFFPSTVTTIRSADDLRWFNFRQFWSQ